MAAASKRAVVANGDDLATNAEMPANPAKVSKTLYTELKTLLNNKDAKTQDIFKARNVITSRYEYKWKFAKNEGANGRAPCDCAWSSEASWILRLLTRRPSQAQPSDLAGGC